MRNLGPSLLIIVPIHHESWFLGSIDSTFSPISNSFVGGIKDYEHKFTKKNKANSQSRHLLVGSNKLLQQHFSFQLNTNPNRVLHLQSQRIFSKFNSFSSPSSSDSEDMCLFEWFSLIKTSRIIKLIRFFFIDRRGEEETWVIITENSNQWSRRHLRT